MRNRLKALLALWAVALAALAQIPSGYYSNASGKSGEALKTALCGIIYKSTAGVSYSGLKTAYEVTDVRSDGYLWDIYSDISNFEPGSDFASSYKNEGDGYNREHTVPQSWFNEASPMVSDVHHVLPVDAKVNGIRSNYPYGEVETISKSSNNDFSKLGTCKSSLGYTGTVFEPNDEYKGDIARIYFYMATCYENQISSWSGDIFGQGTYPGIVDWELQMLLTWAANDPVSQKEIDRNNNIYYNTAQANRNPYVDFPGLEQLVFGSKTSVAFDPDTYNSDSSDSSDSSGDSSDASSDDSSDSGNSGDSSSDSNTGSNSSVYSLVTSTSQLVAGKKYIIAAPSKNVALYTQSGSYRTGTNVTISSNTITVDESADSIPVVLTLGGSTGAWTFYDSSSSSYLALNSSSNALHTSTDATATAIQWGISLSNSEATITSVSYSTRALKYNSTNPRFACYTASQTAVALYVLNDTSSDSGNDGDSDGSGDADTSGTSVYTLVTSTSGLSANKKYIIVSPTSGTALYTQSGSYRTKTDVSISNSQIEVASTATAKPIELTLGGSEGAWTFYDASTSTYLAYTSTATSGANYLHTATDASAQTAQWTIAIAEDGTATIANCNKTTRTIRYNSNSNSERFACYLNSSQNAVALYVLNSSSDSSDDTDEPEATAPNAPTFSIESGTTVVPGTEVTISTTTEGATIVYTVNDGETQQATTSATVAITEATTITAYATSNNLTSETATATYTVYVAPDAPTFSVESGAVASGTEVTIATATEGATVVYTINDGEAQQATTSVTLTITEASTITAYATANTLNSATATATYTIQAAEEADASSSNVYTLVTSTNQLVAGKKYLLFAPSQSKAAANCTTKSCSSTEVTVSDNKITLDSDAETQPNIWTLGGSTGAWTFYDSDNEIYLACGSSTAIVAGSNATSTTAQWAISFDTDDYATIKNVSTNRYIRFYRSGTTQLFRGYASTTNDPVQLYVQTEVTDSGDEEETEDEATILATMQNIAFMLDVDEPTAEEVAAAPTLAAQLQAAYQKAQTKYYRIMASNSSEAGDVSLSATYDGATGTPSARATSQTELHQLYQIVPAETGFYLVNANLASEGFDATVSAADPTTFSASASATAFQLSVTDNADANLLSVADATKGLALNADGSVSIVSATEANAQLLLESVTSFNVNISSVGYATGFYPFPVAAPENLLTYVGTTHANGRLQVEQTDAIAARSGMIFEAAEGTYTVDIYDGEDGTASTLSGTNVPEAVSENKLVFAVGQKSKSVGFYSPNAAMTYFNANRAYYVYSSNAIGIDFVGSTTGISSVFEAETASETDAPTYDLQGRRVARPARGGIYIQNGRKVVK